MPFYFVDEYTQSSNSVRHVARHIINAKTIEKAEKKIEALKRVVDEEDSRLIAGGHRILLSQWSETEGPFETKNEALEAVRD